MRSLHGILQCVLPISLVFTLRLLHRLCRGDCLTAPLASDPAPENPEGMWVEYDLLEHSLDIEGAAVGGVEELELVALCMSFLGVSDVCLRKLDGSRERL